MPRQVPTGMSRLAGAAYLASFVIPLLAWVFILSKLIEPGDGLTTARRVLEQEALFRAAVLSEVVSGVIAASLGVLLFATVRVVNRTLATLGLVFKITEAAVVVTIGLGHLAGLLLLKSNGLTPPGAALVGSLFGAYLQLTSFAGLFLGLSMMVFSALLSRTDLIPRALAYFGVFAYAVVLLYDALIILRPQCAEQIAVQAAGIAPVSLFTLTASLWLLAATAKDNSRQGARP